MALLAAWCGLRFGELAELRRADIDLANGVVRVRRGVVRAGGPRSGTRSPRPGRDVAIPPHLMPLVHEHLIEHAGRGRDALLFPAARAATWRPRAVQVYYPARDAAGRPDLRFHDLRHTGADARRSDRRDARRADARLGHSTPGAAMRYQHAADDRDEAIAAALSGFHGAKVVTLRPRGSKGALAPVGLTAAGQVAAQAPAFLKVPLQQADALGGSLGLGDAARVLLGADGRGPRPGPRRPRAWRRSRRRAGRWMMLHSRGQSVPVRPRIAVFAHRPGPLVFLATRTLHCHTSPRP